MRETSDLGHPDDWRSEYVGGAMKRNGRWRVIVAVALALVGAGAEAASAGEPPPGTEIVSPVDQAIMVYVPSGVFTMGLDPADGEQLAKDLGFKDATSLCTAEAYPKRKVNLPGFFMDQTEVTVERWNKYVRATGTELKSKETSRHFDDPAAQLFPAAEIPWEDARKYAAWAGKLLPTEAQWEKAARGADGRLYPWGNEPPSADRGHFGEKGKPPRLYVVVGRFPKGASPYGALDMLGNQYEWTSEMKSLYPGHPLDPADPLSAQVKEWCDGSNVCLRGGSWYHGWISFYAAKRFGLLPNETYYHVGFRTVWVPPAGYFESAEFTHAKAAVPGRKAQLAALVKAAEQAGTAKP
jgi:iron(II)-dependent oxidoreductase